MGPTSDDTTVIAHRGFAGRYPENTVAAVEAAARGGTGAGHAPADMVEVDVVPTADGTPVVFHDKTLGGRADGGLTDRSGTVWETDTETVTGARVLGTAETVPTLDEVLAAIPPSVGVNVEFKNPGSDDLAFETALSQAALATRADIWRPFTDAVLDVVDEYDNDVLVSSFYEAALSTVRERAPSVPVAVLVASEVRTGLEIARRHDCEAVHVALDTVPGTPFADEPLAVDDLVALAHGEDRRLNAYTVRSWYQARQLVEAGVDGIIAEYPGLLGFEG
ncbi:glycerophosphodiester phosphodiesterase [Haloarcula laminariae]|uniref:glycerophosphodiester phosphodiesterase n=1 Tax=Haloarcula laminariae TaxID=2961577 RepID=UPI002406E82B|nr:glycerophosphodiester phosphodiesterase [Halomicroarcula sp. FL173]